MTAGPDIVSAARVLTERGLFGIVWLDEDLRTVERYGSLVDFIPLGRPATEGLLVLLGFEDQLRALKDEIGGAIDIPNVGIDHGGSRPQRVNVNVFWDASARRYIVVVSRILAGADIEVELARQIRARSIAEAEIVQKSRELEAANAELSRINEDLEEFTSIISHDLKAPLRALGYFTGDLMAAVEVGNRAEIEAQIGRVRAQTRRMSAMLSGLLDYARVGRKEDAVETVDTGALAREIAASLAGDHRMTIEVAGEWPRLETAAAPLDLVLRNLVDNAIKHHDRAEGHIRLAAEEGSQQVVIRVSDDGPGIPPAWHEAIFRPFRRVERSAGPEGAGIGLAAVRKTLERLGGTIEVRSDPSRERGTTFVVRWPRRIQSVALRPATMQ